VCFKYLLRRSLQIVPTLVGISLISFFLMQLAPGGPIDQIADLNPKSHQKQRKGFAKI